MKVSRRGNITCQKKRNSSANAIRKAALACFPLLRNYLCSYTGVLLMVCHARVFYASIMPLHDMPWLNCYFLCSIFLKNN